MIELLCNYWYQHIKERTQLQPILPLGTGGKFNGGSNSVCRGISGATSPASNVHGEGKKSEEDNKEDHGCFQDLMTSRA